MILFLFSAIHMAGNRIDATIAKVDVAAVEVEVEMTIEVAIDMESEVVEVALVLMGAARTGSKWLLVH